MNDLGDDEISSNLEAGTKNSADRPAGAPKSRLMGYNPWGVQMESLERRIRTRVAGSDVPWRDRGDI